MLGVGRYNFITGTESNVVCKPELDKSHVALTDRSSKAGLISYPSYK